MKIWLGGIHMEANSFNPILADIETFRQGGWYEGEEMQSMQGKGHEVSGMYDCLQKIDGMEVIEGFFTTIGGAAGPVKDTGLHEMVDIMLRSLEEAGRVDGVLLSFHGAMQSETIFDCEGYMAQRVREIVGPEVPICCALDWHALFSEQMLELVDGFAGYMMLPHIDRPETGYRAAQCLVNLIKSGKKPKDVHKLYKNLPFIVSLENSNSFDSPSVPALDMLKELQSTPGVLCAGMFMTQPWLDVPELGLQLCVYLEEEDNPEAERRMNELADYLWDNRRSFTIDLPDIPKALELVQTMEKPVIFVDFGDVPNAGSTGDSTAVLKAFLDAGLPYKSCVVVADAQSAARAVEIGEGGSGLFSIGGFGQPGSYNERIPVEATVQKIDAQPFVHLGPITKGFINRAGIRALLVSGNVYIIICEKNCLPFDRNMLLTLGIDPKDFGLISMRVTYSFQSTYEGVMGSWLFVDTPGCSTRNHRSLPYRYCKRPIYPLEDI